MKKNNLKKIFNRAKTQIRFGKEKVKRSDKLIECLRKEHTIKYAWNVSIKKNIIGANLQEVMDNIISSRINDNDIQKIRLTGNWSCVECDDTLEFEPKIKTCEKCGSDLELRKEGYFCSLCKKVYTIALLET